MSTDVVSAICKAKGGFRTPELNEQLYLHFGGFVRIEGLEEFVNCRCLWLENNGISIVENLEPLVALSALYLQHNALASLGCCSIPSLRSLNVCHNNLTSLDGLQHMPNLEKLLASNNSISDISALASTAQLTVLDLSHNQLHDADITRSMLRQLPLLASLMLHGNDFVRDAKNYREEIVTEHAGLRFLDEYPVFDDERRCCVAFMRGGEAGRKAERDAIRQEERDRQATQRAFFEKFIDDAKTLRHQEHGAVLPPTDYFTTMARDGDQGDDPLRNRQAARDWEAGEDDDAGQPSDLGKKGTTAAAANDGGGRLSSGEEDEEEVYIPPAAAGSSSRCTPAAASATSAATIRTTPVAVVASPGEATSEASTRRHADPCAPLLDHPAVDPPRIWVKEIYTIPMTESLLPCALSCRQEISEEEILSLIRPSIPPTLFEMLAKRTL
jgi:dynein assembly factor 1